MVLRCAGIQLRRTGWNRDGPPRVQTGMDPVIEYLFGVGDGHTTSWHSPADTDLDTDGVPDAVGLDFDGDGRRDDLLADLDGDGVADVAAIDADDDGTADHFYRDSGRGLWDIAVDRNTLGLGDRHRPPPAPPMPPATRAPVAPAQPPPGAIRTLDTDGDGRDDAELVAATAGRGARLYLDTDEDGDLDTVLVDTDGDGAADESYRAGAPEFRRR